MSRSAMRMIGRYPWLIDDRGWIQNFGDRVVSAVFGSRSSRADQERIRTAGALSADPFLRKRRYLKQVKLLISNAFSPIGGFGFTYPEVPHSTFFYESLCHRFVLDSIVNLALLPDSTMDHDQATTEQLKHSYMLKFLSTLPVFYLITLTIYRKFFHPLARFPGPPLAALSSIPLWRLYQKGFPEDDFEDWHKQYDSKVIRISPNELHISGAESYKKIYNQHSPAKYGIFYDAFLAPGALFTQNDIGKHREKRKLMSPLFSKSCINSIYPLVLERMSCVSQKISERCNSGPINIVDAYRCLTIDIISAFCFGQTLNLTNQAPEGFRADYLRIFDTAVGAQVDIYNNTLKRFIWPRLPFWATMFLDERVRETIGLFKHAAMCLQMNKSRTAELPFPVLFDRLAQYSDNEQISEAMSVLIAGSDTTAYTLSIGTFHILNCPQIKEKLQQELRENEVNPDQMPSLIDLEKLPYLVACMKESLRIAMPVPGRLPRVLPANGQPLVIDGKVIPPGSIVGCSAYSVHYDESIWGSDARQFKPERWLMGNAKQLDNYLVAFSKGSRQCIGMNLAEAEILTVFAHVFRKFDMELVEEKLVPRDFFATALPEEGIRVNFRQKSL